MSKNIPPLVFAIFLGTVLLMLPSYASAQTITRLTTDALDDISPTWDPRGEKIAYIRPRVANG